MAQYAVKTSLTVLAVVHVCLVGAVAMQQPPGAAGTYQVVKVCSLLSAAEVKKLAPWPDFLDRMKPEEEALGTYGSSCNYPRVHVQVMSFRQDSIDSLRKSSKLESAAGVGDAAWIRNNGDRYAELMARVGGHLLTVQLSIPTEETFDTVKPTLLELGKAFAARLR